MDAVNARACDDKRAGFRCVCCCWDACARMCLLIPQLGVELEPSSGALCGVHQQQQQQQQQQKHNPHAVHCFGWTGGLSQDVGQGRGWSAGMACARFNGETWLRERGLGCEGKRNIRM